MNGSIFQRDFHQKVRINKTTRAGITFSVSRAHRYMKKGKYAQRIRIGSAVYAAVVLEYLVAEVLELSGKEAKIGKKKRIFPRHIMLAIRKDEELSDFLKDVVISYGGVTPNIHQSLLNVKKK